MGFAEPHRSVPTFFSCDGRWRVQESKHRRNAYRDDAVLPAADLELQCVKRERNEDGTHVTLQANLRATYCRNRTSPLIGANTARADRSRHAEYDTKGILELSLVAVNTVRLGLRYQTRN